MPEIKSERDQIQLSLSLIADISRHYIPNFSNVNRILRARVPIVKTSFDLAPIDIDISIELSEQSGHHGFIMANYMSYCVQSKVVRQFLVFLKHWARQHGQYNKSFFISVLDLICFIFRCCQDDSWKLVY